MQSRNESTENNIVRSCFEWDLHPESRRSGPLPDGPGGSSWRSVAAARSSSLYLVYWTISSENSLGLHRRQQKMQKIHSNVFKAIPDTRIYLRRQDFAVTGCHCYWGFSFVNSKEERFFSISLSLFRITNARPTLNVAKQFKRISKQFEQFKYIALKILFPTKSGGLKLIRGERRI